MINPARWYVEAAQRWAWRGVSLLALGAALAALALVYSEAPSRVGLPLPESVNVVPASGPAGFPVEAFACDDATTVRATVTPDGISYEVLRVKDNVPELVVWVPGDGPDNPLATWYHLASDGTQLADTAIVNPRAAGCIRERAG